MTQPTHPKPKRFTTQPRMWEHNQEISQTINSDRVVITRSDGSTFAGVGIFSLGRPRQMLHVEDARRLALQLADAIESIRLNPDDAEVYP